MSQTSRGTWRCGSHHAVHESVVVQFLHCHEWVASLKSQWRGAAASWLCTRLCFVRFNVSGKCNSTAPKFIRPNVMAWYAILMYKVAHAGAGIWA